MSDLARLAAAIAKSSDPELSTQLIRYLDSTVAPCNQFALANLLLTRKSLDARIRPLHSSQLSELASGKSNAKLRMAWLADETSAFVSAAELARELLAKLEPIERDDRATHQELNPYDSVRCLTELCYFVRRNWAKRTGSGLKAADIKTVAQRIALSDLSVKACFELLIAGGIVMPEGQSWRLSRLADDWLSLDFAERWIALSRTVINQIGEAEVATALRVGANLAGIIRDSYPLVRSEADTWIRSTAAMGLVSAGRVTPLMVLIQECQNDDPELIEQVRAAMPTDEPRLIVQSDLRVVVTGPITAELWAQLEGFCDSTDLGVVSSFQLNLASVTLGLEAGWTSQSIADFLEQKSRREVPQPVLFLLRDAERRFGHLEVASTQSGSKVVSRDSILLTQIQNESRLASFRLSRSADDALESTVSARELTLALLAAGYPAVMQVHPMTQSGDLSKTGADWVSNWIRVIRAIATQKESNEQLLQLALRESAPLLVTYASPTGSNTVTVRVLGVTAQRIRCREIGGDAELTLPQSSITNMSFG
ncbi:MAG: hypothetical protein RL198_37 [Actinomycetota bacterium]